MRFDSQIRDNNALIENPPLDKSFREGDRSRKNEVFNYHTRLVRFERDSKRESTKEKYPMEIITRRRYELLCVKINKMPNLFEWDLELDLVRGIK